MKPSTLRIGLGVAMLAIAAIGATVTASPASAAQDTDCVRAGLATLKKAGALGPVARDGLPIKTAVSLGVTPRAGTDVASLPDPLPLPVILADHRAGTNSLFVYPWC
jgi:hypothetical protein